MPSGWAIRHLDTADRLLHGVRLVCTLHGTFEQLLELLGRAPATPPDATGHRLARSAGRTSAQAAAGGR